MSEVNLMMNKMVKIVKNVPLLVDALSASSELAVGVALVPLVWGGGGAARFEATAVGVVSLGI